MRCPRCNGAVYSTSSGYYRNNLQYPVSVSCLNCGWYHEVRVIEPQVSGTLKSKNKTYTRPEFGVLTPIIRRNFDTISLWKNQHLTWADIRAKLSTSYPELEKMQLHKLRTAYSHIKTRLNRTTS